MGHQRRIKRFQRELKWLRQKNQREEVAEKIGMFLAEEPIQEDQNVELGQINKEFKETDAILKRLMPIFPFSLVKFLSCGQLKLSVYLVQ